MGKDKDEGLQVLDGVPGMQLADAQGHYPRKDESLPCTHDPPSRRWWHGLLSERESGRGDDKHVRPPTATPEDAAPSTVPCRVEGDAGGEPVLLLHPWGESPRALTA